MVFEIVIDCCQVSDCMPHVVGTVGITYLRILLHTCVYIHKYAHTHMFIHAHRLGIIIFICNVTFIIL